MAYKSTLGFVLGLFLLLINSHGALSQAGETVGQKVESITAPHTTYHLSVTPLSMNLVPQKAIDLSVPMSMSNASGNCFVANDLVAIHNASTRSMDSTQSWWGAPNGPGGLIGGFGDEIVGNVIFEPFLNQAPSGCPPANTFRDHAFPISGLDTQPFTLSQSTLSADIPLDLAMPSCVTDGLTNVVWYRYATLSTQEAIALTTSGSEVDTLLAVWQENTNGLSEIACNDDSNSLLQAELVVGLPANSNFYVMVATKNTPGSITLSAASQAYADLATSMTATQSLNLDAVNVQYNIDVTNLNGFDASYADVTITVPSGMRVNSVNPSNVCVIDALTLTCSLTGITVNQVKQIQVTTEVYDGVGGDLTATAQVLGDLIDPMSDNNSTAYTLSIAPSIGNQLTEQDVQWGISQELTENPYIRGIDFALVDLVNSPEEGHGVRIIVRTTDVYGADVGNTFIQIESDLSRGYIALVLDPEVFPASESDGPLSDQFLPVVQCELLSLFTSGLGRAIDARIGEGANLERLIINDSATALNTRFLLPTTPPAPSERSFFNAQVCLDTLTEINNGGSLPGPEIEITPESLPFVSISPEVTNEPLPESMPDPEATPQISPLPIPATPVPGEPPQIQEEDEPEPINKTFVRNPDEPGEVAPVDVRVIGKNLVSPGQARTNSPDDDPEEGYLQIQTEFDLGREHNVVSASYIYLSFVVHELSGCDPQPQPYIIHTEIRMYDENNVLIHSHQGHNFTTSDLPITGVKRVVFDSRLIIQRDLWNCTVGGYQGLLSLNNTAFRVETDECAVNCEAVDIDGRIAYVRNDGNDDEIFIAQGTERIQITDNDVDDEHPVFSPDGKRIAYETDLGGLPGISVVDVNEVNEVTSQLDILDASLPTWSPDTTRIGFLRGTTFYNVFADGRNEAPVLGLTAAPTQLEWSPDGRFVLYVLNSDIWGFDPYCDYANLTCYGPVNLTAGFDHSVQSFGWSPDRRQVAITVETSSGTSEVYIADVQYGTQIEEALINPVSILVPSTPITTGQDIRFVSFSGNGMQLYVQDQGQVAVFDVVDPSQIQQLLIAETFDVSWFAPCPDLSGFNSEDISVRRACFANHEAIVFFGAYHELSNDVHFDLSELYTLQDYQYGSALNAPEDSDLARFSDVYVPFSHRYLFASAIINGVGNYGRGNNNPPNYLEINLSESSKVSWITGDSASCVMPVNGQEQSCTDNSWYQSQLESIRNNPGTNFNRGYYVFMPQIYAAIHDELIGVDVIFGAQTARPVNLSYDLVEYDFNNCEPRPGRYIFEPSIRANSDFIVLRDRNPANCEITDDLIEPYVVTTSYRTLDDYVDDWFFLNLFPRVQPDGSCFVDENIAKSYVRHLDRLYGVNYNDPSTIGLEQLRNIYSYQRDSINDLRYGVTGQSVIIHTLRADRLSNADGVIIDRNTITAFTWVTFKFDFEVDRTPIVYQANRVAEFIPFAVNSIPPIPRDC